MALSVLRQDRRQQAGKAVLQIAAAQRIDMGGADIMGIHQPCVAQHAEVMGNAGFGAPAVQLAAAGLAQPIQAPHNIQAQWVAQGVQHALESKFVDGGMFKWPHGGIIANGLSKIHNSNIIELQYKEILHNRP